jgi:hypothetical protein
MVDMHNPPSYQQKFSQFNYLINGGWENQAGMSQSLRITLVPQNKLTQNPNTNQPYHDECWMK